MTLGKRPLQGWSIVTYSALAISSILAIILIFQGINEPAMRIAIRATARTSCILFVAAFVASALRRIWSNKLTTWLLKNRRYFGLSFAVSHGFHAIAIIALAIITSGASYESDPGGMLGYFFLITMTITSFRPTAAWLSQPNWQILHTVGMYYLWLAFIYSFGNRLDKSMYIYSPFVILLILAILLRLISLKVRPDPTAKSC